MSKGLSKEKLHKVNEVLTGEIIQTVICGVSLGSDYYKIVGYANYPGGRIKARKRFTQEVVYLHPHNRCRVVTRLFKGDNPQLEGFGNGHH